MNVNQSMFTHREKWVQEMLTKFIHLYLFYCNFLAAENVHDLKPHKIISQGSLTGKYMHTRNGKQFSAYLGIPYAKPPVGNLRFQAPSPAGSWTDDLNATQYGSECSQDEIFYKLGYKGNENCLFLNIYTPQLGEPDIKSYPVMVFIHGGAFVCGTGNIYGPDYLLDEDIVLVTFNYRLGPLGFLSIGDDVLPGNNGLKDQSLALKWVNNNIGAFGGDTRRITIFGQSAGGASTHFHMFSPLSRGLFSSVISQSGTVFNIWALKDKQLVVRNTKKLAQYVGCTTENHYTMVECLRSVDARKLVLSQQIFYEWDIDPLVPFTPVIEENKEGSFLPSHPVAMFKSGRYANVPWITGLTSEEGSFRMIGIHKNKELLKELDQNFDRIMAITMNERGPEFDDVAKRMRKFYFGDNRIDGSTLFNAINLYSDIHFNFATHQSVNLHFKYSKQPIYYYLFSHACKNSIDEFTGTPSVCYGTSHGDEANLQFKFGNETLDQIDLLYSNLLNKMWTNFAKQGNPTPETDSVITIKWEPVSTRNLEYYHIGGGVHSSSNLYWGRMKFWEKIDEERKLKKGEEL